MKRVVLLVVAALLLPACALTGDYKTPIPQMSDGEYLKKSPEEQTEYRLAVEDGELRLAQKRYAELKASYPIPIGGKGAGYMMQCIKVPAADEAGNPTGKVMGLGVYPSTNPPDVSSPVFGFSFIIAADDSCNMKLNNGTPQIFAYNQAVTNDVRRDIIAGIWQTLGLAANGSVAAGIDALTQCKNCGATYNISGGNAAAVAENSNENTSSVGVEVNTKTVNETKVSPTIKTGVEVNTGCLTAACGMIRD